MGQLTAFHITKVYLVKEGTTTKDDKSWDWTLYNFHTNQTDNQRFGYFHSGNKPVPTEGMGVAFMEYDEKEVEGTGDYEGQTFTNRTVTTFKLADGQEAPPPPTQTKSEYPLPAQPMKDRRDLSMYVSYAKDLVVGYPGSVSPNLAIGSLCHVVVAAGIAMWQQAHGIDPKVDPEIKGIIDNVQSGPEQLKPLTDVPKGEFNIKVAKDKCPIDANNGESIATIYCTTHCDQVKTCEGFRDMMPEILAQADINTDIESV